MLALILMSKLLRVITRKFDLFSCRPPWIYLVWRHAMSLLCNMLLSNKHMLILKFGKYTYISQTNFLTLLLEGRKNLESFLATRAKNARICGFLELMPLGSAISNKTLLSLESHHTSKMPKPSSRLLLLWHPPPLRSPTCRGLVNPYGDAVA